MAKLLQNSFVTPQNLIPDSQFLRGGGYPNNYPIGRLSSNLIQILPNWWINFISGKGEDIIIQRGRGVIRITGKVLSGSVLALRTNNQILSESGEYFLTHISQYFTFGVSIIDNIGNLEPKSYFYVNTIDTDSGYNSNFYYRNTPKLTTKKSEAVSCFTINGKFRPCIRVCIGSDAFINRYINFDISISDLYLYEGLFTNAKSTMDFASLVGMSSTYIDPKFCETFMLPEHLPFRAREMIIEGARIHNMYKDNPDCQWIAVIVSERTASNQGTHHIFVGSLYFTPSGQNDVCFRKYDIFCWDRRLTSGWSGIKHTLTLDSSFSVNSSSSYPTQYEPNPELAIDNIGNVSRYSIRFKRSAQNMEDYSKCIIRFFPEFISDNNNIFWEHVAENLYKVVP